MKFIVIIFGWLIISQVFAITLSPKQCPLSKTNGMPTCWSSPQSFEKLNWVEAYSKLYQKMQREYAFTKWRKIHFDRLYLKYLPAVKAAAKSKNLKAYFEAVRGFIYSIPDGHVIIYDNKAGVFNPHYRDHDRFNTNLNHLGFSYGFDVVRLHNGKYIAAVVDQKGTAYKAGMRVGAQIFKWNKLPIAKAVSKVSGTYRLTDPQTGATTQYINFEKARRLTRAPTKGAKAVEVTFKNPHQSKQFKRIEAYDDQLKLINQTSLYYPDALSTAALKWKLLTPQIGYIRIPNEAVPSGMTYQNSPAYQSALKAIAYFNAHQVKAVILDTRGNMGGADALAVAYLDLFADHRSFYEMASGYDKKYGQFVIPKLSERWINPAKNAFKGLVVDLINPGAISSGEGFGMLKRLKSLNGKQRGFVVTLLGNSTFGSFGNPTPMVTMPGNFVVQYTVGRSLNQEHKIQLDSRPLRDGRLVGGVHADRIFKLTAKRAIDKYTNGKDVALDLAVKFAQKHLKSNKQ